MKTKRPIWYWLMAVLAILWNLMGLYSFYLHTFITKTEIEKLPLDQQQLHGEYPVWTTVAFAFAVFFGLLGSLGLIFKKKWAKPAFIVSLFAIIPQMIHNVFYTSSIKVFGTAQAITMPILVFFLALALYWFSSFAKKKGWLS